MTQFQELQASGWWIEQTLSVTFHACDRSMRSCAIQHGTCIPQLTRNEECKQSARPSEMLSQLFLKST